MTGQIASIIDQGRTAVARWKDFAGQAGVSQITTGQIAQSLPQLA